MPATQNMRSITEGQHRFIIVLFSADGLDTMVAYDETHSGNTVLLVVSGL